MNILLTGSGFMLSSGKTPVAVTTAKYVETNCQGLHNVTIHTQNT